MKNMVKLFGIIAMVAVIGFSMVACGGDDDDTGGKTPGGEVPGGATPSVITVTNIPAEHNGKYIRVEIRTGENSSVRGLGNEATISSYSGWRSKIIAGTTVALNTFELGSDYSSYVKSTKSGTFDTNTFDDEGTKNSVGVTISTDDKADKDTIYLYNTAPVTLTNGSATINWTTLSDTDRR